MVNDKVIKKSWSYLLSNLYPTWSLFFIFIVKQTFILLIALADGSALHNLSACKCHKHLTVYVTQSFLKFSVKVQEHNIVERLKFLQ